MIDNPYVSIVSGTYNRRTYLQQMISSVRSSVGLGISYEIVIVDGGSNDGTLEWLRIQKDVVLVEQGQLLGAVKAFNAGFRKAKGKYVIVANDDIEFRYESIQRAISFMDDNLLIGIGCFPQNRHNKDQYTIDKMPVVLDGKKASLPYGQVCIISKWLGDEVGWWGDYLHTYAADAEMSANVYELGYKIAEIPSACINDYVVDDELRKINNPVDHLHEKGHPDSVAWSKKWTRNNLLGPNIVRIPTVSNPLSRVPRIVYAPIYEDRKFPHQLETKFGLRKELSDRYLISEISLRKNPELLYYDISMFLPDICLIQCHDSRNWNYDMMMKCKEEFKNTLFISWNGDYNIGMLHSNAYKQVIKLFDIACFVCEDIREEYESYGINFQYWQIGFEEYISVSSDKIERNKYDTIFLGNCYNPIRQRMGEIFRKHKEWKTGLYGEWPSHIKADGVNQYNFIDGDKLYRSSKIAIGDNLYPVSVAYISNRIFQCLHSGVFLLQQRFQGMEEVLGLIDGKHLVIWEDLDDLQEKITEWLPKENERYSIGHSGKEFVDTHHSFRNRVDELDKMIADYRRNKILP
jgi:glycosyltransferase involved in cell wall biosynthesis